MRRKKKKLKNFFTNFFFKLDQIPKLEKLKLETTTND